MLQLRFISSRYTPEGVNATSQPTTGTSGVATMCACITVCMICCTSGMLVPACGTTNKHFQCDRHTERHLNSCQASNLFAAKLVAHHCLVNTIELVRSWSLDSSLSVCLQQYSTSSCIISPALQPTLQPMPLTHLQQSPHCLGVPAMSALLWSHQFCQATAAPVCTSGWLTHPSTAPLCLRP